jgi:hypothetical protein
LDGSQSQSVKFGEEKNAVPLPVFELRPVQLKISFKLHYNNIYKTAKKNQLSLKHTINTGYNNINYIHIELTVSNGNCSTFMR